MARSSRWQSARGYPETCWPQTSAGDFRERANSLTVRKLIFRDYPLDIVRFALDPISETSVRFDRHALNNCINHWGISCSAALRALALVLNVIIRLEGM